MSRSSLPASPDPTTEVAMLSPDSSSSGGCGRPMSSSTVGTMSMRLRLTATRRGLAPGHVDDERHVDERIPQVHAVPVHPVLVEDLAVVRGDDHGGLLPEGLRRDVVEQSPQVMVGEPDLPVVGRARPVAGALAEVGRLGVRHVERVRVEVVRPT